MLNRLPLLSPQPWFRLVVAALLLCAASHAQAQALSIPPLPSSDYKPREVPDKYPEKPSLPPAFAIPVGPLGYVAPSAIYLFRHDTLVSLDFLDENRLLFSFHVATGLLPRDANAPDKERQIRAVVLHLPDGKIDAQASWIVPDWSRYLWMLNDGHFLLRNGDGLVQGDAALTLTPYLRFPGRLLWIEMDPAQKILIANSLETAAQNPGHPASPATADPQHPSKTATLVARTLQRESLQQIRISRVPWTSQTKDWPINSDGYLEKSRDSNGQWLLGLNLFAGGDRPLGHVDSQCAPDYRFASDTELLVTVCDSPGEEKMLAMSAGGNLLWSGKSSTNAFWQLLIVAPNGLRVARETLLLRHPADKYKHNLSAKDFLGQVVNVLDTANGKIVLEAPVSPMLDGGGNVAISPSGRRVALLNDGAIQLFELPAPPPLPAAGADRSPH